MQEEVQAHILKRFDLLKKVGSGAYGHVWKVQDKKSRQVFALKKVFNAFQHNTDAQRTYRQVMFLQQLTHHNIIKLFMVFKAQNDKDVYLLFQHMEADLHQAIREEILQDVHKRFIVYQILKALKYMHSASLIHRDLKPSNILLNSDCKVKLCDFGLIRSIHSESDQLPVLTDHVATRWYRAPQILLGSHFYDTAADVWSLGCIVAQLYHNGRPLFPGGSTLNQMQRILSFTGKPSKEDIISIRSDSAESMLDSVSPAKVRSAKQLFPNAPGDAIELISSMLTFNPSRRPSVNELLKSAYVQKFKKDQPDQKVSTGPITVAVSDNTKLHLKEYRHLIYQLSGKRLDHKSQRSELELSQKQRSERDKLDRERQDRDRAERDRIQKKRLERQRQLEKNIAKEQQLYKQQLAELQRKKQLAKDRSAKNFKQFDRQFKKNQKSLKEKRIEQELQKMLKAPSFIKQDKPRQQDKRFSFMAGVAPRRSQNHNSDTPKTTLEKFLQSTYLEDGKRTSTWHQPLQSSKSASKQVYGPGLKR